MRVGKVSRPLALVLLFRIALVVLLVLAFALVTTRSETTTAHPQKVRSQAIEPILLLQVTASPGTLVVKDQPITFRIRYGNLGTSTADSVTLDFFGPNHAAGEYFTQLLSLSHQANDTSFAGRDPSGVPRFRAVHFFIGTLRPMQGGEISVTLKLLPDAAESRVLTGIAAIQARNYRPSSAADEVIAIFRPFLKVSKDLENQPVFFGSDTTFVISVQNAGNVVADTVIVWDKLPRYMTFLGSSPDTAYTHGDTLFWILQNIRPGALRQVRLRVHLAWPSEPYPTQLENHFGCDFEEEKTVPDPLQFEVAAPPLPDLIPVWVSRPGPLSPGFPGLLSLRIRNEGGLAATDVWLAIYVDSVLEDSLLVDQIGSNSEMERTWIWKAPITGTHHVRVCADPRNAIKEVNEDNNCDELELQVAVTGLHVQINAISLADTLANPLPDGCTHADFPYPLIAYVSVTDQNGYPVRGLADTLRWLSSTDSVLVGGLVRDVWDPLKEYHLEDHGLPPNPDLYAAGYPVWVREVPTGRIPISVVLVMDYSGSMSGFENTAESAVLLFLSMLKSQDRMGVIHFASDVTILSSLTSDKNQLASLIPGHRANGGTALFDALYAAVGMLSNVSGRKAVIVYTDGNDNESSHTAEEVVEFAAEAGVSIYGLGLGSGVDPEPLTYLASRSGGQAVFSTDITVLTQFYRNVLYIIGNYYILAYGTPDPQWNCSWRVLDATLHYHGLSGADTASYHALCGGPDASIEMWAAVDSHYVNPASRDTLSFVKPAEEFTYLLDIRNKGAAFTSDLSVADALPSKFQLLESNPPISSQQGDTLRWKLPPLGARRRAHIALKLRADYESYFAPLRFVNVAWVQNDQDTVLTNNQAADTLYPTPPELVPPEIRVFPDVVEPGDSVQVTILTHVPTADWWLEVEYGDGSRSRDYPSPEIRETYKLVAGQEFTLPEKFGRTRLKTSKEEETIRFWVGVRDIIGREISSDAAAVVVRGKNKVVLNQNVFRPRLDGGLKIRFELSSNRAASVKILDISGREIRVLADKQPFLAGWNEIEWDGTDDRGFRVGSGIYVVTVESGSLKEWRKFVLIR